RIADDPTATDAKYEVNRVDIPLPSPLKPGGTISLTLCYSGGLASASEVMAYVKDQICEELTILRQETYPYPQVAGANPVTQGRFSYRLAVTIPEGYVVANVGVPRKVDAGNGWATYRCSMPAPRWRLDIAIGKFDVLGSRAGGALIYCLPKHRQGAEHLLGVIKDIRAVFDGWWGPLGKQSALIILQIPEGYGSQADPPAVILTADCFEKPSRAIGLSHEMAHFYNPAGGKDPARWMSEGFATFIQLLVESRLSDGKLPDLMESTRRQALSNAEKMPDMAKRPLNEYQHLENTTPSYIVGSLAFHQLYLTVREQTFHKIIAELYRKFGETPCEAGEWLQTAERVSGRSLDKWAQDWVLTSGCWELLRSGRSLSEIAERYSL
ncbi:MAG: hypothetical protein NTU88_10265, partial [Armatimonadetes bacterium]|nr:hypothetical protein [Armatimonadota bacterium]